MPPCWDCYVWIDSRSRSLVERFLARFLPHRRELTDAYPLPWRAQAPEAVYRSADALLAALEMRPTEPHALYWDAVGAEPPRFAMVFPSRDGGMVLGLSVDEAQPELAELLLAELRRFFGGDCPGYVVWEEPPPSSRAEFLSRAGAADAPQKA